jgi:hypothetical protein
MHTLGRWPGRHAGLRWGVALSVLAHGAAAVLWWPHGPAPVRTSVHARAESRPLTVWLRSETAVIPPVFRAEPMPVQRPPSKAVASVAPAPAMAASSPPAVDPPPAVAAEAVAGVSFAPPRLAFGMADAGRRWMQPPVGSAVVALGASPEVIARQALQAEQQRAAVALQQDAQAAP